MSLIHSICSATWFVDSFNMCPETIILPENFKFDNCAELESLTLRFSIFHHQRLPWVTSLLSRATSDCLRKIRLEVGLLGSLDTIDWENVDNVLCSRTFRHLKALLVNVRVWSTANTTPLEVCDFILKRLPNLRSRGIVQFPM